jgi:hypothetical protein
MVVGHVLSYLWTSSAKVRAAHSHAQALVPSSVPISGFIVFIKCYLSFF